ncbi:MAG: glycosyltransferase family 9 protein [bacterium]
MKIKILKLIDIFVGKILCLMIGYLDYLFNWTSKDVIFFQPHKILVIRPGGLGDFLYLLPMLATIKKYFPSTILHVLAEKRNRDVSNLTNIIDKVLCYDSNPFLTIYNLRRGGYDLVIDSEQFHNFSGVFSYLTQAKIRIGFKINPFKNHLYTHLVNYSLTGQESKEFLSLLEPLGIKNQGLSFRDAISLKKIKESALLSEFINWRKRFDHIIIIAPRGHTKYRYWSPKKYQEIINYLIKDFKQLVILVGGKSEANDAKEIIQKVSNLNNQVISLVEKTSLLELSHIIIESDLFIGCDSGIAILAAILETKSVTIFGSADENKWGIMNKKNLIVRKNFSCSPCQVLGNYKYCRDIKCMEDLSSQDVISIIKSLGF